MAMAKQSRDWTDILVKRGIIGPDQLKEAQRMGNTPIEEALAKLGYAEPEQIMKAKAEQHGFDYVELQEVEIPPSVIELVPESLARENTVMPLAQENGAIKVIMHNPMDFDTIDKLRFVLNPRSRSPWRPRKPSSRPSIATTAARRRRPTRSTPCSRNSPTPPSTSPRTAEATVAAAGRTCWKRATRRSSAWCT